ncbi:MAG: helix-hairpin-helix domain-containing protein, partial [Anaerotignaceae bacterium]
MAENITITGTVEDIIYQNSENGYAVFAMETEDDSIVCVGTVPNLHTGESLKVMGKWVVHPSYGKQLSLEYYEKNIPTTIEGIEKYLSSGLIKGIGAKTAKKIVDKFCESTFYIIEEKPDRLVEVRGITYEKAKRISEIFREQHEIRRAMIFLQDFGITPTYALKIYKQYKAKTFDIVNTNPYRLADDIFGIGFKLADKLALNAGISQDSAHRIKSGIRYVLNQSASDGHVFLPLEELLYKAQSLLETHTTLIENGIIELQLEHQVWQERIEEMQIVYLNMYYYAEVFVAKKILELLFHYKEDSNKDWNKLLDNLEAKENIS